MLQKDSRKPCDLLWRADTAQAPSGQHEAKSGEVEGACAFFQAFAERHANHPCDSHKTHHPQHSQGGHLGVSFVHDYCPCL